MGFQYNQIRRLEQRIDSSQSNIRIIEERNQQLLSKANRLVEKHQQTEKETVVEVVKSRPGFLRGRTSYIGNAREFDYYLNEMPDLVVNQNVEKLLEAIFETENELTNRRLIYNQEVELFNAEIQQFPVNLLAKGLKIQKKDYYLTVNDAADITDEMLGL